MTKKCSALADFLLAHFLYIMNKNRRSREKTCRAFYPTGFNDFMPA